MAIAVLLFDCFHRHAWVSQGSSWWTIVGKLGTFLRTRNVCVRYVLHGSLPARLVARKARCPQVWVHHLDGSCVPYSRAGAKWNCRRMQFFRSRSLGRSCRVLIPVRHGLVCFGVFPLNELVCSSQRPEFKSTTLRPEGSRGGAA